MNRLNVYFIQHNEEQILKLERREGRKEGRKNEERKTE
jgi:hypothetical protein